MTGSRHFCEVFFEDVRVPAGNLVGELNGSFRQVMRQMEHERGGIARLVSNRRLYEDVRPLADSAHPLVRQEIAAIETGYRIGRLLVLRETLGQAPKQFSAATKTFCTELEQRIAAVWQAVLGFEQIGVEDNFFDLGGDSFGIISIIQRLGQPVTLVDFMKNPTIRSLAERFSVDHSEETSILHRLTRQPKENAPAVVCFPYGGGNVIVYEPLSRALGEEFVVYAVGIPGHDIGDTAEDLRPLDEVAAECAREVGRLDRPVFLYGHCAGSALAIEVARRLQNEGADLRGVFIGGAFPASVGSIPKLLLKRWQVRRVWSA